jgi:tripartite-type tricarboxylate transporter receptor subunit TctC
VTRRDFLACGLLALAAGVLTPGAGYAQGKYPERPVRLIVPFPPGGAYDTIGRPWGERMKGALGTVVIENIGGGGGSVGAAQATRQRPDGYTLLLGGATTHITEGLLKTRPMYDPLKDLVPVSGIAVTAFAITVHPSVPVKDLKQLIALARKDPAALPWGSAGHGSLNHLTGELFKLQTGIPGLTHVPYKGAGPAIIDLIAGHVPMIVPAMTNHVLALHRAGRARILAVTHGTRLAAAPEIPTAAEQGLPTLVSPNFIGIYAPAGTPREAIEYVSAANLKLLADRSYRELLVSGTFEIEPALSPEAYKRYVEDEMKRWAPIVKTLGVKIDF